MPTGTLRTSPKYVIITKYHHHAFALQEKKIKDQLLTFPRWRRQLKRKLITANHILHQQGVVDAYGHISVRCPGAPDRYLMCGYMAPGVVTSADDLIEYFVRGSSPVSPHAKKGYSERFIHGEIYEMFPDVNCVVHSHAEAVLPYVTSGVPLMPVFHMAGFLGEYCPARWD